MKKTVFALFAVILVLSLATCDLLDSPDTSRRVAKGDMVSLTINIADGITSRAMNKPLAQPAVTKYEIVFNDSVNGDIYRFPVPSSQTTIKIEIPAADYTGANKAVVFAGDDDNNLLAIGRITGVDGTDLNGGSAIVTDSPPTTSVTFTLVALTSGVTDTSLSSFHLLGPTAPVSTDIKVNGKNFSTDSVFGAPTPAAIGTYTGGIPQFNIPAGRYNSTGSNSGLILAADGSSLDSTSINTNVNVVGRYTIKCGDGLNYKGVQINPAMGWSVTSVQPTAIEVPNPDTRITVTATKVFPTGTSMPQDGSFYFNISNSSETNVGYTKVYIEVPVVAISTDKGLDSSNAATVNPVSWKIKGGVDNTFDKGPTTTGGAVLLFVDTPSTANPPPDKIEIEVEFDPDMDE